MDNRQRKTRARRIVLGALLLIAAAQGFASWLIDQAPLSVRFSEAARVVEKLRNSPQEKTIVFFGTSRTRADIGEDVVMQELAQNDAKAGVVVRNGAVPAGDPIAVRYLHEHLTTQGVKLSLAVIEILPETLSQKNAWMGFHIQRQFRWREIAPSAPDAWRGGRLGKLVTSRLMPLSFFRYQFQVWLQQVLNLDLKSSAHAADETTQAGQTQQAAADTPRDVEEFRLVTAKKRTRDFRIGGATARNFELLLDQLRASGTEVILLSVPLPSSYRSAYEGDVELLFAKYLEKLKSKYDFTHHDFRSRLPDRLFKDRYYLNDEGRVQFSRLVATEVLRPRIGSR